MNDSGINDEHIPGTEYAEIVSNQNPAASGQNLHDLNFIVVRVLAVVLFVHITLAVINEV